MSEKRKPVLILLASKEGQRKKNKIEIFNAVLFTEDRSYYTYCRYRIRVNGVWYPKGEGKVYFRKDEVKKLIVRSIKF